MSFGTIFAFGRPVIVTIEKLECLPKKIQGSQYVSFVSDRNSDFLGAIPINKTSLQCVANLFFAHWVIFFQIPAHFYVCNGSRERGSSLFYSSISYPSIKHQTTSAYHDPEHIQNEWFNRKIVSRILYFVAEYPSNLILLSSILKKYVITHNVMNA